MPAYSKYGARLGRPRLAAHLHERVIERRAGLLESFEQFCAQQTLRLKKDAVGIDEETYSIDVDTIERAYRELRLGPALSKVDHRDQGVEVDVRR